MLIGVTFDEAVQELARMAGVDARKALEDEHVRWRLYEASVPDPARRRVLQDAIRAEANAPLASAVVTRILEVVQDGERSQWVALLPAGRLRVFGETRAAELRVWEEHVTGNPVAVSPAVIERWSQWLQLRLAERIENRQVLEGLSEAGATKRIRRLAGTRLNLRGE